MGRPRIYSDEERKVKRQESLARYRELRRENTRAANRRYEAANPEKVRAKKRAWFDDHPDYLRGYYAANRPRLLLAMARLRAKKLGIPCTIRSADIVIPKICPVLGIEIRVDARGSFNPHSPSLDRIIPSLGYVLGNVRVISNRANLLKKDATLAELEALAAYVRRETRPREVAGLLSAIA